MTLALWDSVFDYEVDLDIHDSRKRREPRSQLCLKDSRMKVAFEHNS